MASNSWLNGRQGYEKVIELLFFFVVPFMQYYVVRAQFTDDFSQCIMLYIFLCSFYSFCFHLSVLRVQKYDASKE